MESNKPVSPTSRNLTPQQMAALVADPPSQLPVEFRLPVWDFWACWSHVLKNQLALVSRIRHWITDEGMTLDDLLWAFRELSTPEEGAGINFAGELLAKLSGLVARRLQSRREQAEVEARRREAAEFNDPAYRTVVRDLLRNWRSGGTTGPDSDQP